MPCATYVVAGHQATHAPWLRPSRLLPQPSASSSGCIVSSCEQPLRMQHRTMAPRNGPAIIRPCEASQAVAPLSTSEDCTGSRLPGGLHPGPDAQPLELAFLTTLVQRSVSVIKSTRCIKLGALILCRGVLATCSKPVGNGERLSLQSSR